MVKQNHKFKLTTTEDLYRAQRKMLRKSAEEKYDSNHDNGISDYKYDLKVQLYSNSLEDIIDIIGFEKVENYIRKVKLIKLQNNG